MFNRLKVIHLYGLFLLKIGVLFSEYFTLISFENRVIHWDKGVYEGFHMQ